MIELKGFSKIFPEETSKNDIALLIKFQKQIDFHLKTFKDILIEKKTPKKMIEILTDKYIQTFLVTFIMENNSLTRFYDFRIDKDKIDGCTSYEGVISIKDGL